MNDSLQKDIDAEYLRQKSGITVPPEPSTTPEAAEVIGRLLAPE